MKSILPVHFSVVVNGQPMGASLVQIEDHVIHSIFVVRFADGYEDGFFDYEDDSVRGVNEKQSRDYAKALNNDLWLFNLINPATTSLKHFLWEKAGAEANAWLFAKKTNDGEVYTVYLEGNYMFDISEKKGSWIIRCKNELHSIDRILAEHAVSLIGKTPALPPTATAQKEIEFPLEFSYDGKKISAFGILVYTNPFPQCHVAIKTFDPEPHLDVYQFFKIDSDKQVFTWNPCPTDMEPVAAAIAKALEKKFSTTTLFSTN